MAGVPVFQITLSAMLVSMFVAPFLINRAARLSVDLGRGDWAHKATVIHNIAVHSLDLGQHVVICGYGRTGQRILDRRRFRAAALRNRRWSIRQAQGFSSAAMSLMQMESHPKSTSCSAIST